MRRLLLSAILSAVLGLAAIAPPAVSAVASWAAFEQPTATATFGTGIEFRQSASWLMRLSRIELLLEFPDSIGPVVIQTKGVTPEAAQVLIWAWSAADGHLSPNTPITARWRLVPADRTVEPAVGPPLTITYADTRFAWKTLKGDIVSVHWYEGSNAFGRRALALGEKAVRDASEFMGVTESEPIDFFIYADQAAFYDAMGPDTRENVVGTALSSTRTMLALIPPGDVAAAEVARTVPHELTHLVFDTAVHNPYHYPPRWLNEGVATYLTEGFTPSDRAAVKAATAAGRLMPLSVLDVQFPTTYERFLLAYAESTSAVSYLVDTKGSDALVSLVNSYANGVTDDEAFTAAVGTDLAGFEAAWLAELGADPPTQYGPQAAPAGPLPPGWEVAPSAPPGSSTAEPSASAGPGASGGPSASPAPGAGSPAGDDGSPLRDGRVLLLAALAGLAVGGGLAYARRRRARTAAGGPMP